MKQLLTLITITALLAALLSGCAFHITTEETLSETENSTLSSDSPTVPSSQPEPSSEPITPSEPVTEPATEPTISSEPVSPPPETDPPVQTAPSGLYLVTVTWADHPVYSGPDYDSTCVGTVQAAGVYTIMEEVWDGAGNLWGRLKSGMGWIDVTGLAKSNQPVTADYADEYLLLHGYYYSCIADQSEYAVAMVFRAQENLQNVRFSALILNDAGYALGETLGTYSELPPEIPLVVWASFPGDMSAYCLSFTDSAGAVRHYLVSISGMDGSLELRNFRPS